ncbi:MAG: cell envelope biogenesis protein OmpA [Bacteroidetes bacterium]|nr:MAG: cell envelope biogenesis protein OmpA [Bacteroidota bacterium]
MNIYSKLSIALIVISLGSCVVGKKKYDQLLGKKVLLEGDFAECSDSLNALKAKHKLAKADNARLSDLAKRLAADSNSLADKSARTQKALDEQNVISDRLRKDYKDLLANYSSESNKMSSNLAKKEQQLLDMEKSLQDTKNKRVTELEAVLKKKDAAVNELKNKVTNALLAFNDKDLTVNVKNGKVYVSLSEQLLFKSGSTEVDKKGKDALKKLGGVLKTNEDVNVMVEGHTDDVPVAKGAAAFSDNWDLSVLRATEITRILIDSEVNPKKITPAGRAEFVPLNEGKSAEIRQKNRRTEIILTPKLDELFKILEGQ